eukprot:s2113_g17.t1
MLDLGDRRPNTGASDVYEAHLADEEYNSCETSVEEWKMRETAMERHLESFLVNDRSANELRDKDLTNPEDVEKVKEGKIAEWDKLMKHRAIRLVEGPEAAKIRSGPDAKRIMDSRFDMGKELGKVSDDLAPFQNKDLTPEQQAGLTQLMSNKESAAFAKKIYAKVQADKKKAAETKAKLDGLIGMMGFTKRTADNQPEYGMPPAGKNQIKPISELNLGALMKKPSAPPPTGLDALPKAAAAALPKEAAAALESPTGPAAHPLLQKLVGGAKGPGAGAANPAAQKLTAGAGAKGPGAGYGDAEAATKDASVEVIPALGGGFKNPLKAKSGDEEAATKDETMTFNGFKVDVQSEEELKAQHAKLKEQLKGGYGGYGPDGEAANKDAETPAATGTAPTAPAPHPLLHMVKENGQALKDHPRLKHLLEAFKAKHATPKHNKAPDLQDLLKQADATSLPSRDHPRLKALVEEAEHMKETVV